jgi:cell division protein ZapA
MGQVSVPVNGRTFAITCDDGQEARTRHLAQYVDAKVVEFVARVGQVGDAKLLLLAALVITDELAEANDALQQERSRPSPNPPEGLANRVRDLSKPVEAIAERLRTS